METTRALAMKPRLVLLDECMAGMPPKDIDWMVTFLKKLKEQEGIAVIVMVEHIMRAVVGFAERVIVMHEGLVKAAGSAKEIKESQVREAYLGI